MWLDGATPWLTLATVLLTAVSSYIAYRALRFSVESGPALQRILDSSRVAQEAASRFLSEERGIQDSILIASRGTLEIQGRIYEKEIAQLGLRPSLELVLGGVPVPLGPSSHPMLRIVTERHPYGQVALPFTIHNSGTAIARNATLILSSPTAHVGLSFGHSAGAAFSEEAQRTQESWLELIPGHGRLPLYGAEATAYVPDSTHVFTLRVLLFAEGVEADTANIRILLQDVASARE